MPCLKKIGLVHRKFSISRKKNCHIPDLLFFLSLFFSLNSLQKEEGLACCSGHFVVLWIILGIITFGILLGVVLMFTVA